jgi:hypothetical protein
VVERESWSSYVVHAVVVSGRLLMSIGLSLSRNPEAICDDMGMLGSGGKRRSG